MNIPAETNPSTYREIRRRTDYPSDDLGFLQRTHPLRGSAFGQLVYMADSIMQPMRRPGFGMHPHVNVEVVSYVLDGELTHRDSAGNVGVVAAGAFQRITAGTGIAHDESNRTDAPLRMFQIWFEPAEKDVEPSYATVETAGTLPKNAFMRVIGQKDGGSALDINADASISLGRFTASHPVAVEIDAGRAALLYVVRGGIAGDGVALDSQDQLRVSGPARLSLRSIDETELLLIESAA